MTSQVISRLSDHNNNISTCEYCVAVNPDHRTSSQYNNNNNNNNNKNLIVPLTPQVTVTVLRSGNWNVHAQIPQEKTSYDETITTDNNNNNKSPQYVTCEYKQ